MLACFEPAEDLQMALDSASPRSRRTILAASLGGVAALAAHTLDRPTPVHASDPNDVVLGQPNLATTTTEITNPDGDEDVFRASTGGAGNAIEGFSTSGAAIVGTSGSDVGVTGSSQTLIGVHGYTVATTFPAVMGRSLANGPAVYGYSGVDGPAPTAPVKTGVYGWATQDASSSGVAGQSTAGRGVHGTSESGRGVNGVATSGLGVRGYATEGVGLSGEASTGYALRTKGRVRLDKSAGITTVASGAATKVVTPGIDLTSTSAVVETLNGNAGGATVERVTIDTAADTFPIVLTGNATASVKVAWLVLG
jgi:hypothetical protein